VVAQRSGGGWFQAGFELAPIANVLGGRRRKIWQQLTRDRVDEDYVLITKDVGCDNEDMCA